MVEELFPGVYRIDGKLATENKTIGFRVYGEKLLRKKGKEYRDWDTFRSKLAAAIRNGLKSLPIRRDSSVLYLGASGGTTASHIADISEIVYCVEFSKRMMHELLPICEKKRNMIPILGDASKPMGYYHTTGKIDVIYQDVAQPNQADILLRNVELFKPTHAMLAIKARSINSVKMPKKVFEEEIGKLKGKCEILQTIKLKPFNKDHVLVNLEVKNI